MVLCRGAPERRQLPVSLEPTESRPRSHKARRLTPAMAAGLTTRTMEMADVVNLIDNAEMKATVQKRVAALGLPHSN
jgi:hypothetical protein